MTIGIGPATIEMPIGATTLRAAETNWRRMIAMMTDREHVAAALPDSTTSNSQSKVLADVAGNAANTDLADQWECVAPGPKWPNVARADQGLLNMIAARGSEARADVSGPDEMDFAISRLDGRAAAENIADSVVADFTANADSKANVDLAAVSDADMVNDSRGPNIEAAATAVLNADIAVTADLLGHTSVDIDSLVNADSDVDAMDAAITVITAGLGEPFTADTDIAGSHTAGSVTVALVTVALVTAAEAAGLITETADTVMDLAVMPILHDIMRVGSGFIDGSVCTARITQVARRCGAVLAGTKAASAAVWPAAAAVGGASIFSSLRPTRIKTAS